MKIFVIRIFVVVSADFISILNRFHLAPKFLRWIWSIEYAEKEQNKTRWYDKTMVNNKLNAIVFHPRKILKQDD